MWNRESFQTIFKRKGELEESFNILNEGIIQWGMKEEVFQEEKKLKKEYEEILLREEVFWRKKSRETWLKEGDRNTTF